MNRRNVLPRDAKLLLVASTGGHLTQLNLMAKLLGARAESVWVSFPSPQSEALLATRRHEYVPYIRPRDWRAAAASIPNFVRFLKRERFDGVLTTGAAVAVPALIAARLAGTPASYLESISRVRGPSLSGRIARHVPGVSTFTQHRGWATTRWRYDISVLDSYIRSDDGPQPHEARVVTPRTALVSLGTIKPYRFDRLVDRMTQLQNDNGLEITWQLGVTSRNDLDGPTHEQLSNDEFMRLAESADVVVSHAGVGTLLQLVERGIHPVVVPRRSAYGEHVDDHQEQIAMDLAERGLIVRTEASALTASDLIAAAALRR